nr:G protein-coupled receptor [Proales similis]
MSNETAGEHGAMAAIRRISQHEFSLFWLVFGTVTNLLSLLVLIRPRMRIHSTFTYLIFLSVCDLLVLYFGLLRDLMVEIYEINITNELVCKFHVFSFYFVLHLASWLLVAVNIDRLIAASFLTLSKRWCTPRNAVKVSLVIALFLFVLNSHFILLVGSDPSTANQSPATALDSSRSVKSNQSVSVAQHDQTTNRSAQPVNPFVYKFCVIDQDWPIYNLFFQTVFPWIDISAQVVLPFIIMLICNVNIIQKVLLAKNRTNGKNSKRLRKIRGMCVMIVTVSILFFILEAPALIFICLMQSKYFHDLTRPEIRLFWAVANLMMYFNHGINFLSYCMTGTKFRRELIKLLFLNKLFKQLSNQIGLFSSNYQREQTLNPTTRINNPARARSKRHFARAQLPRRPFNEPNRNTFLSLTEKILRKKRELYYSPQSPAALGPTPPPAPVPIDFELESISNDSIDIKEQVRRLVDGGELQPAGALCRSNEQIAAPSETHLTRPTRFQAKRVFLDEIDVIIDEIDQVC